MTSVDHNDQKCRNFGNRTISYRSECRGVHYVGAVVLYTSRACSLTGVHSSIADFMRQIYRLGVFVAISVAAISVAGCRGKFKHRHIRAPHAAARTLKPKSTEPSINLAYMADAPLDLAEFERVRAQTLSAINACSDAHASPSDLLVALAGAWQQAPQGAVITIEMAKVAARAHDERKLRRFVQMARPLVAGQPNLSKALDNVARKWAIASGSPPINVEGPKASLSPLRRLDGIEDLHSVCKWIQKSFAEGRPEVEDVGPQGTDSIVCQTLSPYELSPEVQALPVVAAARGHGQRLFGWVAARWRGSIWLSRNIVESFAPPVHPAGNGFSIELQRASVFRDGVPELSAYITERRTAIDPGLNEKRVTERHAIVMITFDLDPPQTSAPVVLHSKVTSSLVDSSDAALPKGYSHTANLGKVSETTFQLSWGNNRAVLTPSEPKAKPVEQVLFAE